MRQLFALTLAAVFVAGCSDPVAPVLPNDGLDAKSNNNGRPHFVVIDQDASGEESPTWCEAGLGDHGCRVAIEGLKRKDVPQITYSGAGYFQLFCRILDAPSDADPDQQYHSITGWANTETTTIGPASGPKDRVPGVISTGMPGLDWTAADLGLCPAGSEPAHVEGRGGSGTLTATVGMYTFSITFEYSFGSGIVAISPATRIKAPRMVGKSRIVEMTP